MNLQDILYLITEKGFIHIDGGVYKNHLIFVCSQYPNRKGNCVDLTILKDNLFNIEIWIGKTNGVGYDIDSALSINEDEVYKKINNIV